MDKLKPAMLEAVEAKPEPPTPHVRTGSLATIRKVRQEVARLYRDARSGIIPAAEATKLAYLLQTLGTLIKDEAFEHRLFEIERQVKNINEK